MSSAPRRRQRSPNDQAQADQPGKGRASRRAAQPAAGVTRLIVGPAEEGLRLDQYLAAATSLSRRQGRELIAAGEAWRNGSALRVLSRTVSCGDVIDLLRPHDELGCPVRPEVTAVRLLHEDSWLVVADKPAGVLSQPAATSADTGELSFDQLLLRFLAARDGRRPQLRLVHRLDRQTSGTLLFSRHSQALPPLTRAWQRGEVRRLYLAVVGARPDWTQRRLAGAIARDRSHPWRFMVAPTGKPAETQLQVVAEVKDQALLACWLMTGRTHQVRVHLAEAGLPVLGDKLYGGAPAPGQRLLLHAAALALPHPRTGKLLQVIAPLPPELQPYLPSGDDSSDQLLRRLLAQPAGE